MQNGKLNNAQRQALVKLVENSFNRKIQRQKQLCEEAIAQVTREVKAELGVAKMDEELKTLEQRTRELEAARERLGFSKYNDNPIPGTEARRMIDQGTSAEKERVTALQSEMDRIISAIWTATELSEAKQMVDSVLGE